MYLLNLKKEEMDDNYINMYVEICFRHFDVEFLMNLPLVSEKPGQESQTALA